MKIRGLLTTPLLATLLAISYRAAHKIPLDFAEFYDELFQILLVRHDGAKLGWRRQRKTKLNDRQIQQIFEAFCFSTRKRQLASVDQELAESLAAESAAICDQIADPQLFLQDIKNITCLIVDEGKKMNFVHISVQEFFASRYIRTRADGVAKSFYTQLLAGKWEKWQEELLFLQQIDSYRAAKYFFIPDLSKTVDDIKAAAPTSAKEEAINYLNGMVLTRALVQREGKEVANFIASRLRKQHTHKYFAIDSAIFKRIFSNYAQGAKSWNAGFPQDLTTVTRTYLQVAQDRGPAFAEELIQFVAGLVSLAKVELRSMQAAITREDAMTSFVDI